MQLQPYLIFPPWHQIIKTRYQLWLYSPWICPILLQPTFNGSKFHSLIVVQNNIVGRFNNHLCSDCSNLLWSLHKQYLQLVLKVSAVSVPLQSCDSSNQPKFLTFTMSHNYVITVCLLAFHKQVNGEAYRKSEIMITWGPHLMIHTVFA